MLSCVAAFAPSAKHDATAPIKARIAYIAHDPIYIASDADWAASGFPGDGTEGNPYMISGYDITGVGGDAVNIQGTTVHFVIEDCYLHGDGYGVYMYNAENATLINDNCSGNAYDGIYAWTDNRNLSLNLSGCLVLNNGWYGVDAYAWPGDVAAVITGCNVSGNSYGGIYLEGGNNLDLTMTSSNATINGGYGVELWSDNWDINATLEDCDIVGNYDNGMYVEASNSLNLTITSVDIEWNSGSGIEAYSDYGDVTADIDGCYASYNGWTGIYLYAQAGLDLKMNNTNSSWNAQSGGWSAGLELYAYGGDLVASVTGCDLSDNGNEGIYARGSYGLNLTVTDSTIARNDASYGYSSGIEAYANDGDLNLTMISSEVSDQADQGMYLEAANNLYLNLDSTSIVRNRDGDYGGNGIEGYTYYGEIVVNMDSCNVSENYGDGVYLESWSNLRLDLSQTTVSLNPENGIYAYTYDGGIEAVLDGSTMNDNGFSGVYLQSSYELLITMNDCDLLRNGANGYMVFGLDGYSGDYTTATIDHCRFVGNFFDGLYLSDLVSTTITNNTFSSNGALGITFTGFDGGLISDNVFMYNGQPGLGVYYATGLTISHNTFADNSADGLAVTYSSGCTVSWNLASGNLGYGLGLYSSSGCTVWNNTVLFNRGSTAVWDAGTVQGYDDTGSNAWYEAGSPHGWGNFWSDWTTPDDDMDGIVDYPYELDGGAAAEDPYPLTTPLRGYPKLVFGFVYDPVLDPLAGADVVVMMKDGETVVSTRYAQTDSSGGYDVSFAWLEWDLGYTIEVVATHGGDEAFQTSLADVAPSQEVDVMFEYEIPQFGSILGFLAAGLFVGLLGAFLLVRGKKRQA